MTKKIVCKSCKAKFMGNNQINCGICESKICPNCSSCECITSTPIITKKVHTTTVENITSFSENELVELSGTLSPLIKQTPILTKRGKIIKSDFEFSDQTGKIGLVIWGPVPEKIFPYRYEFCDVTLSAIKIKQLSDKKLVLNITKSSRIYLSNLRTKTLADYLSQAS